MSYGRVTDFVYSPTSERLFLARPEGFEPPTPWFVARYSIQMSYGRFCCTAKERDYNGYARNFKY